MTPAQWTQERYRLEKAIVAAKRWVYPGQPEETKAAAYQILRNAEDALTRHLNLRTLLISKAELQPPRVGRWRVL